MFHIYLCRFHSISLPSTVDLIFCFLLLCLQSIERIPERTVEEEEEDNEEESKFCTLPRSNNGFTIRQVCMHHYSIIFVSFFLNSKTDVVVAMK